MASQEKSIIKTLRPFWLLINALLLVTTCPLPTEAALDLSQVKKLYVAPISGETGANELHASLLKHLSKTGQFQLVDSPEQADAVLKGTGQLWLTGYIYVNPRAPTSERQAVYGGFLSVELVGHDNQVLWSYLVTPAKFSSSSVPDDLSGNLVKRLIAARSKKNSQEPAAAGSEHLEPTTLHGAGATFPAPLYLKWLESFEEKNPAVQVQYDSVGSEAGIRLLTEGKADFAGSDVPPDTSALQNSFLRFPTVLGGVVPIYNLKNVGSNLKFTPEMLAGIYLAKITKWNDPLIQAANKGIPLPNAEIAVVHRSDGSGTTYTWSDFLSKTSTAWKSAVGTGMTLEWPAGIGAEHNDGVATLVQKTPNSIGYVELVYAIQHQLSFGLVRNAAGEFIHADLEALAAAAEHSLGSASELPASITNSRDKGAYPIATFTWLLLPKESSDQAKKVALVALLRWLLTDGQKECSALGYAPLPHSLANWALRSLSNLP